MRISLIDRSLYLKALMLLIRKDLQVHGEERNMMLHIGAILGFDHGFCEETIDAIVDNKHVNDEPPLFSEEGIARCFVKDALRICLADGETHEEELQWVKAVAVINGIQGDICGGLAKAAKDEAEIGVRAGFEAEGFEWEQT
jgi:hypothetical protein